MAIVEQRTSRRSRRAILAGAAGALGALATRSLVAPEQVEAANPVLLGAANTETTITTIRNTAAATTAVGLVGRSVNAGAKGLQGVAEGSNGIGVYGVANIGASAAGVYGGASLGHGLMGAGRVGVHATGSSSGASATATGTGGIGVIASAPGGTGVKATGNTTGVDATATASNGTGVLGVANTGTGARGVYGRSATGTGVVGEAPGDIGETYGVYGIASAYPRHGGHGYGVYGYGISGGVYGRSPFGAGVEGHSDEWAGVYGESFYGVIGQGIYGGVRGTATPTSGASNGVYGEAASSSGVGVWGKGNTGLRGEGVATGVWATGTTYGVNADGGSGIGVRGTGQTGVSAEGGAVGLSATGSGYGVHADSDDTAVFGAGVNVGVWGQSTAGLAGYFAGSVEVTGDFSVSGTKNFMIDHPTDPANRTLTHACMESPEVLNLYRGTVILDGNGGATVRLPGYFAELNTNYGYQLTSIGTPAPALHIARTINGSSFRIAGGTPGQEVCWQVTGVRNDAWMRRHPMRVEQRKGRADRGRYLNPELYGASQSQAIHRPPTMPPLPTAPKAPKAPRAPRLAALPEKPRTRRRRRLIANASPKNK